MVKANQIRRFDEPALRSGFSQLNDAGGSIASLRYSMVNVLLGGPVMKSILMLFVLAFVLVGICHAAEPSDSATAAQRWVAAKFLGVKEPPRAEKSFLEAQLKPDALVRDRIEGPAAARLSNRNSIRGSPCVPPVKFSCTYPQPRAASRV